MSITIPARFGYAEAELFLVDAGSTVRSPLTQEPQRINRLGDRFGLSVKFPPLSSDADARQLVALLNQARSEGIIMRWPQVNFAPGTPGAVLVNGGGQAGSSLAVDGVSKGYAFRHGQFGNFTAAGKLHLFQITADVLWADGSETLPILPMIRKSPADNSAVTLVDVKIEGWPEGDGAEWSVDRARMVGLGVTVIE